MGSGTWGAPQPERRPAARGTRRPHPFEGPQGCGGVRTAREELPGVPHGALEQPNHSRDEGPLDPSPASSRRSHGYRAALGPRPRPCSDRTPAGVPRAPLPTAGRPSPGCTPFPEAGLGPPSPQGLTEPLAPVPRPATVPSPCGNCPCPPIIPESCPSRVCWSCCPQDLLALPDQEPSAVPCPPGLLLPLPGRGPSAVPCPPGLLLPLPWPGTLGCVVSPGPPSPPSCPGTLGCVVSPGPPSPPS